MTRSYSPKTFLRQASNLFLDQYFKDKNIKLDLDFSNLKETKIDELYRVINLFNDKERKSVETDFQDIFALSDEKGLKELIIEARLQDIDYSDIDNLKGFYDKSFWFYLNHNNIFKTALLFANRHLLSSRYWRKRNDMPIYEGSISDNKIKSLENEIGKFFQEKEGKGRSCQIDYYNRGSRHYFFAYPEDYSKSLMEWENNSFKKTYHTPAFETIFIYEALEGSLDIYVPSDMKTARELQQIFSQIILEHHDLPEKPDKPSYSVAPLKNKDFNFKTPENSNIKQIQIRKMWLKLLGDKNCNQIMLDASSSDNTKEIYNLIDKVFKKEMTNNSDKRHPISLTEVTQAEINIIFDGSDKRDKSRTFKISYPHSCNLKHDNENDEIIREVLAMNGIEIKPQA